MAYYYWQDGGAHKTDAPFIYPDDRGVTLGDGLFETLPAFARKPFLLDAHLNRLKRSGDALYLPFDGEVAHKLIARALEDHKDENIILRLEVTRGRGARGLHIDPAARPSYFLTASPWAKTFLEGSVKAGFASIVRNEASPSSRHKTCQYLDNIIALEDAKRAGFNDAILLNSKGCVTCATTANLFVLIGERLLTPPLQDGVLDGITRKAILDLAAQYDLEAVEKSLRPDDLLHADAAFITNSARLLIPMQQVGERFFHEDTPHQVLQRLKEGLYAFLKAQTGFDPHEAT